MGYPTKYTTPFRGVLLYLRFSSRLRSRLRLYLLFLIYKYRARLSNFSRILSISSISFIELFLSEAFARKNKKKKKDKEKEKEKENKKIRDIKKKVNKNIRF